MRPPAIEKMGFYPTDEPVVEILKTYIRPAEAGNGRLLDPCAGEGKAASILGKALNCETWGAELSPVRAALASQVMDKVYSAPWQACQLTDESITLLFLNPPYEPDHQDGNKRLELEFLKSTTYKLVRGGLLIYIIPQHILGLQEVARILTGYYEALSIYRFPDGLFEKFKQVIVMGYRRKVYKTPSDKDVLSITELAKTDLPPLVSVDAPVYELLPAPERGPNGKPVLFKRLDWEPEEIVEATLKIGVHHSKEWLDLIQPKRGLAQLKRPVMPLKKGHIAMLMASGMMGTVRLTDDAGHPMLIKGRVVKTVEKTQEEDANDKDVVVEKYRDKFVTTVAALKQDGIEIIQDVKSLADFMKAYGDKIATHVLETYRPLYNFDPTPQEIAVLDTLGRNRKSLPGQSEAGLLSTQRHAAAAMARAVRKHGVGNLQGEMGIGKSTIGAAVIELLDAYPAIIICPPHLVPKWIREVEETTPGAHGVELRRIGRNSDEPSDVNDVKAFLDGYEQALQVAKEQHEKDVQKASAEGRQPPKFERPKWIAVVAHTAAKMGTGWQPAVIKRKTMHPLIGKYVDSCACPTCGGIVLEEQVGTMVPVTNPEDLSAKRHFCQHTISGWQVDGDGRLKRDDNGNPIWGQRLCGTPLFEYIGARRHPIAEYIAKKAHGLFKMLIADEVHQFKSKSSDRGVAFHQLITATKYTLTLTGTFFGGKSTSIFWLLHRLNPGVRKDFGFNDETRWARLYGVLETTRRRHRGDDDEDGVFTGNRRYRNQAKEQPGVSPAIINRLLDTTVFLSLKDLGLALPEYKEEVVVMEMQNEQKEQYSSMEGTLKQMAIQSNRYLSMWLQWSLARPNSAFRDETVLIDQVQKDGETIRKVPFLELPAVVSGRTWLPKEGWLADYCRNEKRQGRKVLVYLRQTGTRDIQDRILDSIVAAGLRATVLSGSVNPRQREAWIDKRVDSLDALICNPKLVETGLDLVQFSTIIFGEIEYSLYTLWQALRRVWRLGQTKPVKALFSVYNGSMEAKALALMGRKMKASQLLYGDEVGGAIVPEEDGDFLTQLARDVLSGAKLNDLQTLFADDNLVSHNPLGCPTMPSAPIPVVQFTFQTWEQWAEDHNFVKKSTVRHNQRKEASPLQATLW